MEKKSNAVSVAALICAIIGIIGSFIYKVNYFTTIAAMVAIVLAAMDLRKSSSRGLTITAIVLGVIGVVLGVTGIACFCVCETCAEAIKFTCTCSLSDMLQQAGMDINSISAPVL